MCWTRVPPSATFSSCMPRQMPLHVGGCHMAGKRRKGVPRDVALRALTEGVQACGHCRPDAELGFLDG
ncbi:DUF6233 domain-containing protein [Streptomyces sp. NPDC047453]|uniref:DUF6233 domain-containing protein n=1 Tax=Streptomyces sp. NPDC047453 TaxID=3154812 RepID=UPI0033E9351A